MKLPDSLALFNINFEETCSQYRQGIFCDGMNSVEIDVVRCGQLLSGGRTTPLGDYDYAIGEY